MRFGLVVAAITLFSIPRDVLVTFERAAGQDRIARKHHVESRADQSFEEGDSDKWSYVDEQSALRAYPLYETSSDSIWNAQAGFKSFKRGRKSVGLWSPIGPLDEARYPAVLDQFLFDGAPYVASGRVTALGIAPSCDRGRCRLYLGAAGGGIWVTDRALSENPRWRFVSGRLGSNAIGSILVDARDASGNTVYVGTGEPNASGDSEAGVGIYKTTDGGATWALIPGSDMFFQRAVSSLALDKDGNLLAGIASAVRGVSSVTSGASSSPATNHPLVTRGVYRFNGTAWTLLRGTFIRGTTQVAVDPNDGNVLYQASFSEGVWRSLDNGATWVQIKTALNPTRTDDRAAFALASLPGRKTRMYVGVGNGSNTGANRARFYRTDDAAGAATFTDMTTPQNIGYCTSQCWYDNYVVSPAGAPDVVYLGGSYSYGEQHKQSNGRAVLLSIDGGATFTDMTLDADQTHAEGQHPDHHALVTVPGNPYLFFAGSDGGLMRSDGEFADTSYKCDSRGLDPASNAYCKSLLKRVPRELIALNDGLNTLQFQSLSVSAQNPRRLAMGGTQDNGTFQFNGSPQVWPQIIYGDGGQSGFKVTDDRVRFNTFTGQANDANFRNGDPEKWVIISAPIISSPEASYFYPPIIADPHPRAAGSIFQGSFSVWRTQDWGGDPAYLEANCPEFTTDAAQPGCGDFVRIGDGVPSTDLGSPAWGTRAGGAVAWLARAPQNTGALWAATGAGRIFITDNANDPASAVHWFRIDNPTVPPRAISQIHVDPADANHAWVSYNGYNVNTVQQGHVFEVTRAGPAATFTDRSYNLPDFPVTALVRDDVTGDLYAGSDFGVMRLPNGSTTWQPTYGMPVAEVAGLTVVPSARILYAATHGFGAWAMDLGRVREEHDDDD
jgi:hypothetical protein